ncbi:unnamed protein product, partial [Prunus brigantina]
CLYLKSTPKSLLRTLSTRIFDNFNNLFSSLTTTARATMDMIIETDKEGYAELFVKWYEDAEVLQMVKKSFVKAISTMDIDNVNNGIADTPKQKLKWYENPELLQIFKKMFGCTKMSCLTPPRSSVAALKASVHTFLSSPFLRFSLWF